MVQVALGVQKGPALRCLRGGQSDGRLMLPSIPQSRQQPRRQTGSDSSASDTELLPPPKKFGLPKQVLRTAIYLMKKTEWTQVLRGVEDVVQVARFSPEVLEGSMVIVNRTLCTLLRSLRSHMVRTACQAARELFRTMQCTHRPEFDDIAGCLLHKTADMNLFIRQDANEALDAMVTYITPFHVVRVLTDKGASHKNPLVRTATARLLTCVVVLTGANVILSSVSNKEIRRRILVCMAQFLADGSLSTRKYAKSLFRSLMKHEDFETILHDEVDSKLMGRIEKTLVLLRYQSEEKETTPA